MRHCDLGVLDTSLLLFGGPYSNLQASQALLSVAEQRGIAGPALICTGDVVAYCGAARETVAAIRDAGATVIAGNCEAQIAADQPDCACGFEAGSACDLLSAHWYPFAASQVTAGQRRWMAGLPDLVTFTHHGARYGVLHGGVRDKARFIWPDSEARIFEAEWDAFESTAGPVNHMISGHCGVPSIRDLDRGRWINAGVIGMPPHDGEPQTRYAVLDRGDVTFETLDYDVAGAQGDMDRAGLPNGYRDALASGYWPSEDVLPASLRVPLSDRG